MYLITHVNIESLLNSLYLRACLEGDMNTLDFLKAQGLNIHALRHHDEDSDNLTTDFTFSTISISSNSLCMIGITPLLAACMNGHVHVLDWLMANGLETSDLSITGTFLTSVRYIHLLP